MKKILLIISVSVSTLLTCNLSFAAPHHHDEKSMDGPRNKAKYNNEVREKNADDDRSEKRRMREERGVQRLQQLKWQEGYVMPQHYRSNSYKVDHKQNNLSKPAQNEQWYKINNQYLLINTDNNAIVKIADR